MNDHIRRALARLGEAQNELHEALRAAHGAGTGQSGQSAPDVAGFDSQAVHQSVRVGTTGPGDVPSGRVSSAQTNGDETVLREYTAPASLIERAKAFVRWQNSHPHDYSKLPETGDKIVRALAAAKPDEELRKANIKAGIAMEARDAAIERAERAEAEVERLRKRAEKAEAEVERLRKKLNEWERIADQRGHRLTQIAGIVQEMKTRDGFDPVCGNEIVEAVERLMERAQRAEAEVERLTDLKINCEAMAAARDKAEAEVERLKNVLRELHANYCTSDWTDRGRHAPECRLDEIEEDSTNG